MPDHDATYSLRAAVRALLLTAVLLGVAVAPAAAQLADPPILLDGRTQVALDGDWAYLVEPFGQALRSRNARRDFPADGAPAAGELVEYDWAAAPTLRVPGDFNHQDPALWLYEGPVWYRTRFPTPAHDGRVFLYLGAANYRAHVFLNDEKLAQHEGGFLPFAVEVTGHLRAAAANSLVIAVDNTRQPDGIPGRRTDWWNYGGLTRSVALVLTPSTYVHDLTVHYADDDGHEITAAVKLDGPAAAEKEVTVALDALDLRQTARTDALGRATVTFRPDTLTRWHPGHPHRYALAVRTETDHVVDQVGFRTVRVRGRELLVNDEPLTLRGVSMHEEAFDAQGRRATTRADYRALLSAAQDLGVNFVRLAHYPHGEAMLHLADSLGLLVWAEVPIYWEEIDYAAPQVLALARRMMADLLDRDANRASVIIWSVANETPITEDRMPFLRTLISDVRRQDPTRLVSAALKSSSIDAAAADGAGGSVSDTGRRASSLTQRVDDPLGADLDVLAVNTYVGWYGRRTPDEIAAVRWEVPYEKPLILTEFGAGALYGRRGDRLERWTEEYQAAVIDETMAVAMRTPAVVGTAPWVLKDFRSPRRWHARFQQFWNRKGLFDETGRPKLAADVLRRWYDRLATSERPQQPLGLTP